MSKMTLYINSGTCKCGHSYEDHHLSAIINSKAYAALPAGYPPYIPEECEYHGSNEVGGLMPIDEPGSTHCRWVDHCHRYEDKDGPLGEVEY